MTPVWPFVEVKGNEGTSEQQGNVRESRERQNRNWGGSVITGGCRNKRTTSKGERQNRD